MSTTRTHTAYGRHMTFKWGLIDIEAKHTEWLDEAKRRLDAHDELVAALSLTVAAIQDWRVQGKPNLTLIQAAQAEAEAALAKVAP